MRYDERSAWLRGRGERRGRRHPYYPVVRPLRWMTDVHWRRSAARERGRRFSSLLFSVRFWTLIIGLVGAGFLIWRALPGFEWVSLCLWTVAAVLVLND